MRVLSTLLFTVLLAATSVAQDAAELAAREAALRKHMVAALHELADAFQGQKQHGRAYALRRELLLDYDEDDAIARDKCGFTKVGNLWRADAAKLVLEKDLTGDKKVLKKLEPKLVALRKQQLAEHRALAEGWQQAGEAARSMVHWRRVLELAPGDKKAAEALATQRFGGFVGTDDELTMLRRAWAIRGAVQWLLRKEFTVEPIKGEETLLAKAGLPHMGVRSEHFAVWGTLPEAQLRLVALFAERSFLLCHTLLGTAEGDTFQPVRVRDLVFVANDADYTKVLDLCADQFDAGRLAFLKQYVDMAFVKSGDRDVRFVKTNGGDAEALDQAVRGVAQDAFGILTDGLWEGIGHAMCGFFFGRTLTFLLEQQEAKTVASFTQKLLVPDMAVWQQIAEQSAWAKSDSRTSELVLISAARFSTEQRVKAWAICDYLWQLRPELLRQLDQSQSEEIHTPPQVEAEFLSRTGVSLTTIDQDWREFWARKSELRAAMATDPLGDEKAKDHKARVAALELVDAVNEVRAAGLRGPVGFYFAEDPDTQAALDYGDKLLKAEQLQKKKPKEQIPLPEVPAAVGKTVLWGRGTPTEVVRAWLSRPSSRDVMLHPGRGLFGANRNQNGNVLDLTEPAPPTLRGVPWAWPRGDQRDVPAMARFADLGPRAQAALLAKGVVAEAAVGMPLTLHFGRAVSVSDLAQVGCRVYADSTRVDGVLVVYQDDATADDTAPGCVAFVPLAPLPAGAQVTAAWRVPKSLLGEGQAVAELSFTVSKP